MKQFVIEMVILSVLIGLVAYVCYTYQKYHSKLQKQKEVIQQGQIDVIEIR